MPAVLFWIFSIIMLLFGVMVITHRNPVSSALSLVVSFIAMAGLFVLLNAYFIGVIQILVYAGAVMVLFLFIIMLLDLKVEKLRRINYLAFFGGLGVTIGFVTILVRVLDALPEGNIPIPAMAAGAPSDVKEIGRALFTDFNLPLQVIGALLLVSTIGVVVLSKRELK